MKHAFLLFASSCLMTISITGCTKKETNEIIPLPTKASLMFSPVLAKGFETNAIGPVESKSFAAVDAVGGQGRVVYLRSEQAEPSGGNQIYYYQDTPASSTFNYITSPGALCLAELDNNIQVRNLLMIVDVQHDIYYEGANGWTLLNSGGLKFARIATRDFYMDPQSPAGLLYGISTDSHVYKFNTSTLTWNIMDASQDAYEVTIDPAGHPWIIGAFHPNGGNIYRAAGYGQAFSGWAPYKGYGRKITATGVYSNLGIAIIPATEVGVPSNSIEWSPLPPAAGGITDFKLAYTFPDARPGIGSTTPRKRNIVGITGLKADKLWVALAPLNRTPYALYAADFTGL